MNIGGKLRAFALDPVVYTTVCLRGSVSLVPAISVILVTRFLTAEQQGYWYLFGSFLAIAGNAELGLGQVLARLTASEVGRSGVLGDGPSERVKGLFAISVSLALWTSIIVALLSGVIGYIWTVAREPVIQSPRTWVQPWIFGAMGGGIAIGLAILNSFFEGMQRVATVNIRRFIISWLSLVVSAGAFFTGFGLDAFGYSRFFPILIGLILIYIQHKDLIKVLSASPIPKGAVNWKKEVWPLQWKYALSWAAMTLVNYLYVPAVFSAAGPAEGGRFGLAMNMLAFVYATASMVTLAKGPRLALLVGKTDFGAFKVEARTILIFSVVLFIALVSLLFTGLLVIDRFISGFTSRLLPFSYLLIGCVGVLGNLIFGYVATLVRSFNVEPFFMLQIAHGIASFLLINLVVSRYGSVGAIVLWAALWLIISFFGVGIARRQLARFPLQDLKT